jgi:hypothetical protein
MALVQNCSIEEESNLTNIDYSEYLSFSKPDFDFVSGDWDNLSDIEKNTFKMAQKRMAFTFDKNGICTTKWTSSSQVNMSEELFDCFIKMIDFTNEVIKESSQLQWFNPNPPRLKSGNESNRTDNCVVQTVYNLLTQLGASYTLSAIDNWISTNNYYTYSDSMWGVNIPAVLNHFFNGSYINTNLLSALTLGGATKYILVLTGPTAHVVICTGRKDSGEICYSDPQNSCSGTCAITDIGKCL